MLLLLMLNHPLCNYHFKLNKHHQSALPLSSSYYKYSIKKSAAKLRIQVFRNKIQIEYINISDPDQYPNTILSIYSILNFFIL